MDSESRSSGFPMTSIREIKILKALKAVPCENIVELIEICRTRFDPKDGKRPEIHLVFEFCDHDLAGLLQNKKVAIFSIKFWSFLSFLPFWQFLPFLSVFAIFVNFGHFCKFLPVLSIYAIFVNFCHFVYFCHFKTYLTAY